MMDPLFQSPAVASPVCLGTASLGSEINKKQSFALLDRYTELGGTFLDTAHIYAVWLQGGAGKSERLIGEWIKANECRDEIVLATKGGHPPLDNLEQGRCSPSNLEADLSESLERLGVDDVDLYWLHRDDPDRDVGEIVETLAGFAREGRIRVYGVSNWSVDRLIAANAYADQNGLPPFVISQPEWSLAVRNDPPAVQGMDYLSEAAFRWHEQHNFPVAAYTAQAKGWFGADNVAWSAKDYKGKAPRGAQYDCGESRARLERAVALAKREECTANQIALAYLLHQHFTVYPIIGTSDLGHLQEAWDAMDVELSQEDCRYLREGDKE